MIIQLPSRKLLTNSAKIEIDWMRESEKEAVRNLLNAVILEGKTYPQEQPLSESEFAAYWLSSDAFVARAIDDTTTSGPGEVLGSFYLKPNFPGRSSHICNAGFIVQRGERGKGIGRVMGEAMLEIAASRGYQGVMFNLVFETNIPSLNLWQSLGFQTIGRIPKAALLVEGQVVDALILYRSLA
ncbi:GCN5-related N-acetyltransferase [Microseira wollei NIES-4236]|uniref:GCN5-related N-acetyltransferase n=2 Tax=Microseira wollei TaxID=467598 RepID=A0AAV3XDX9_9CYAN|nr:GCN5-related N-acetyltransferase [Microseira wollei NIES-4236]